FSAIAAQPFVGGGSRHPQALSGLGGWPAQLGDALDQQQPTEVGQPSISMGHEGPLPARCFDNPSRPRGPSTETTPSPPVAGDQAFLWPPPSWGVEPRMVNLVNWRRAALQDVAGTAR